MLNIFAGVLISTIQEASNETKHEKIVAEGLESVEKTTTSAREVPMDRYVIAD